MLRQTILLLPFLAGCSALEDLQNTLELAGDVAEFEDAYDRLDQLTETPAANIPTTGQVTYTGQSAVTIGAGDSEQILLGNSRFQADFGTSQIDASFTDFSQYEGGLTTSSYTGTLTMTDATIGLTDDNEIEGQVVGTLTGSGDTITVNTGVNGVFGGVPIQGVVVISEDRPGVFTLNGTETEGTFQAYGEP